MIRRLRLNIVYIKIVLCTFFYYSYQSGDQILAQDLIYSQFYNAPLQMNPAFAGNSTAPLVATNYRNQWPALSQSYTSYSFSYDQYFERINSGIGMYVEGDDAGDGILKRISVSGIYSYRLRLNRKLQLKIGLEARVAQTRLDWDKLIFGDQINLGLGSLPGNISLTTLENRPTDLNNYFFDVSTGFLLYSKKYYAGFSLKHMNSPNVGFTDQNSNNSRSGLPIRWSIHAGTQINFQEDNNGNVGAFLSPNLLIVKQSDLAQINVGSLIGYSSIYLGLWYRHGFTIPDAAIVSVGIRKDFFKISYSFDLTISDLQITNSAGSHEIGIVLNFASLYNEPSRYNDCFSIFR